MLDSVSSFSFNSVFEFFKQELGKIEQINTVIQFFNDKPQYLLLICAVSGLLVALFGKKIFRIIVSICGFAVGSGAGYYLLSQVFKIEIQEKVKLIIIFVLGLVVMLLINKIIRIGIFATCGWLSYQFLAPLCSSFISDFILEQTGFTISTQAVSIGLSVIIAILSLIFTSILLIVCTSLGGGYIAVTYTFSFLQALHIIDAINTKLVLIIAIPIVALGLFIQFKMKK